MFKKGQDYKLKIELSLDQMGFGRATVVSLDKHSIYLQIKSKGSKLQIPPGTKFWLVGSSLNNRFNGLWATEVRATKIIDGISCYECRIPRFEQNTQRRDEDRKQMTTSLELSGEEWQDLKSRIFTKNISRTGLGFRLGGDFKNRFPVDKKIYLTIKVKNLILEARLSVNCSSYNWFNNRTEIGGEFMDLDTKQIKDLEAILDFLDRRPKGSKALLSDTGSLSAWVKADKQSLSLLKPDLRSEKEKYENETEVEDFEYEELEQEEPELEPEELEQEEPEDSK